TAVVDEFVARVAADNRINHFFAATASNPPRLAAFKGKLVDQICQAAGGPCKYTGKDMKTAHQGMGITTADFNALVEDLVGAFDIRSKKSLHSACGTCDCMSSPRSSSSIARAVGGLQH